MKNGKSTLERLRRFNKNVEQSDPKLAEEARDRVPRESLELAPGLATEAMPVFTDELAYESIVLRRERPVLPIKEDRVVLDFREQEDSVIWKQRLETAAPLLARPLRAVGRIELVRGPLEWVGTGWLIDDDVLVTNRHVADIFAVRSGSEFRFRIGDSGPMSAATDFRKEIEGTDDDATVFELVRPLHIEPSPGPDLAFFEIKRTNTRNGSLAQKLVLAAQARVTANAAVIGYPAYDSRIPDKDLMDQIYGGIYDRKRFAPGAVTALDGNLLKHNMCTLGGSSGSVVVDLDSGETLGLHFSGTFLTTNYAVRIEVVKRALDRMRTSRSRSRPPERRPRPHVAPETRRSEGTTSRATITIPVTISVSIGDVGTRQERVRLPVPPPPPDNDAEQVQAWEEAVAANYDDREGYREDFLGAGFEVPLPTVEAGADDILEVEGTDDNVLRYEHFSVVMSHSRRMCFYSAVNIDGAKSRKSKRVQWKWDPRIPREQQIMNECYGTTPKFSRGHMTRREDPGWGAPSVAKRGNEDSMHVTNATPQMQAFNAPIWLALEDYALDHAREDDMRISVFTGPYFADDDPTHYGVRVPVGFWKVIAFVHDETGELCATGYEMTQEDNLPSEEEFVFGQFVSPQLNVATQVPIREIAARAGLDFGALVDVDPLAAEEEGVAAMRSPLLVQEQIRFVR